jgi:hypothetical protein
MDPTLRALARRSTAFRAAVGAGSRQLTFRERRAMGQVGG